MYFAHPQRRGIKQINWHHFIQINWHHRKSIRLSLVAYLLSIIPWNSSIKPFATVLPMITKFFNQINHLHHLRENQNLNMAIKKISKQRQREIYVLHCPRQRGRGENNASTCVRMHVRMYMFMYGCKQQIRLVKKMEKEKNVKMWKWIRSFINHLVTLPLKFW